jgi:hypothetical protein
MDNKKRVDHRLTTPTPNKLHRLNNRLSIMFVLKRLKRHKGFESWRFHAVDPLPNSL